MGYLAGKTALVGANSADADTRVGCDIRWVTGQIIEAAGGPQL